MTDKWSSRFLPKLNSGSLWETANGKPQFTVTRCSFTSPRFQISARRSLFSVEFKTPTNTSQKDKESYFVPLKVRPYNF